MACCRNRRISDLARNVVAIFTVFAAMSAPTVSRADEGGVSAWLPGSFGSLAAVPQAAPGWALGAFYYHTSVDAKGNVAAARQATIGRFNPTVNINLNATIDSRADLAFIAPSYAFATPVFGGQLTLGVIGAFGRNETTLAGTLTAVLGPLTLTRSGSIDSEVFTAADLFPQAKLRWNDGVHNYMVYMQGTVPTGTYDASRLANISIGHAAIDGGVGYTYFNPQTGNEFSFVTGVTYNFLNPDTDYRNGIDWHLDWGASKFVSKQVHVGLVGYVYQQLTADSGQPLILGDFKSRVAAVGPQVGYLFPVGDMQGYLNVKGYAEFAAENRAHGWNTWVTFAISPAAPPAPVTRSPLVRK